MRVIPGGRLPAASDQVYGLMPPVAARALAVALPTVALVRLLVVIERGPITTVRVKLFVAETAGVWLSVTWAEKL